MNSPSNFRWLSLYCMILIFVVFFGAMTLKAEPVMYQDSLKLSSQKVKSWIKTRIATARLQNRMKANARAYEDVVQAFFKKRKLLLESEGWSADEFERVEKRISAAISAMDMADDLRKSEPGHQKEIEKIRSNEFYSEEQKEQMVNGLRGMREQQKKQYIEPTKADWPAVKPYRSVLEKLSSWIAGNIPDPPEIK